MRPEVLRLAAELTEQGEPFVLATVVRREAPSSAQLGDAAVITASGAFHGWLGGSCTRPTVIREAKAALADGRPRLIGLEPEPSIERRPGIKSMPMTCHSGGSVDVYIEPVLPAPRLLVFGVTPVARTLVNLAKGVGYLVDVVDPNADAADFPDADRLWTALDELRVETDSPILAVVATQGERDERALIAALAEDPVYVGLVASKKRFEDVSRVLRDRGISEADIGRIRVPAGIDIGAHGPEEIAVSILAQIVQDVRADEPRDVDAESSAPTEETTEGAWIDPVCGMMVETTEHVTTHAGREYRFCCAGCRDRFIADPASYLATQSPS